MNSASCWFRALITSAAVALAAAAMTKDNFQINKQQNIQQSNYLTLLYINVMMMDGIQEKRSTSLRGRNNMSGVA